MPTAREVKPPIHLLGLDVIVQHVYDEGNCSGYWRIKSAGSDDDYLLLHHDGRVTYQNEAPYIPPENKT